MGAPESGRWGPTQKSYRTGTHRVYPPERTLDRLGGLLKAIGITRVGNVSGLDRIGIPVVMVCRPNARSLAVAQGKGVTLEAAKAAGVMESIERYHAEHLVACLKMASYEELRYTHTVVEPETLGPGAFYHPYRQMLWAEGWDLLGDRSCWLPHEVVHTNFTLPFPAGSGAFAMTSSGLASGNHLVEALSHAICEVVERHSTALWRRSSADAQKRTRLDLDTVDDPTCRELLDKYERAGVPVAVWETTTMGLPSFLCTIGGGTPPFFGRGQPCAGMGCHPAREIGLARALTEAAQSRLTLIAGSRDDLVRSDYEEARERDLLRAADEEIREGGPLRRFRDVPTKQCDTLGGDLEWELDCLLQAGFRHVIFVDLTRQELKIPVVRVVVPGCERDAGAGDSLMYVPREALARP
jgi:YcaO-like protein with predicted kinase domain